MKLYFTISSLIIGCIGYAQTFETLNSELPNLFNSISALGDIDKDKDLDLYLSGTNKDGISLGGLYTFGNGTYSFVPNSGLPILSIGSAKWIDINLDGFQDLLIQGFNETTYVGTTDIYINNQNNTFSPMNAGFLPTYMGDIAYGDFNGDSLIDIAVTGIETNSWSFYTKLYKNNGDNTFSELSDLNLPPMNFGRIKFADYNKDNKLDFVLSGYNNNTSKMYTKIFTNKGNEEFTEANIPLVQRWLGDTEWVDYNQDGNIDLMVSGTGGASGMDRKTILYKNNGNGTFTDINANFPGVSHSSIQWEDFDKDGDLDVLILGTTTTPGEGNYAYTIYNNMGNDTFTPSLTALLETSYYGDADTGDIDNNGSIDIIITGYDKTDTPSSKVFMNTSVLSIKKQFFTHFQVYPNPSKNKIITLKYDTNTTSNEAIKLSIFNLLGANVWNTTLNKNKSQLNLSSLKEGVYILKITSNKQTVSTKLILTF